MEEGAGAAAISPSTSNTMMKFQRRRTSVEAPKPTRQQHQQQQRHHHHHHHHNNQQQPSPEQPPPPGCEPEGQRQQQRLARLPDRPPRCAAGWPRQRCVCLPSNFAPVKFPAAWSELRSMQQLCDGAIRCAEGRVFPVHRAILSAVSSYFRALFTNSLRPDEGARYLAVLDVPGDMLGLILDYAYTGNCRVGSDNVERLLPLADRLEVLGLVQLCCHFLLAELKPGNCLGIYKFARHYFCCDLEERGRKYIRQNFKEILQDSSEFKELACEELERILHDDYLNVRNEELVFEAIQMWVESRSSERRMHLPRLLNCVRYGLMLPQYFNEKVYVWSIAQNKKCKEVLQPVMDYFKIRSKKWHTLQQSVLSDELSRPRVPYEILFTVGGWSSGSPRNYLETYDTRADKWYLSPYADATPRAYHGVCTLNNLIYIIGGYDGKEHFNTVRCFDPVTKKWSEKACMYHARCYVSVCTYGGKIYALGGNNGLSRMSSCERYDPKANQWELIAPMNWYRSDASAAALHGRVYVVGGFDGHQILYSVEVYDIEANQWSYFTPMIVPRSGVSLVAFRDCLYAIGGFDGFQRLSSGEKYNPYGEAGEWEPIAKMFNPRSNLTAVVLDDTIFAIGGYDGILPVACVECYDAESNEWYDATSMNLARSALSACVVAGLGNVRDYSHRRNNQGARPRQRHKPRPAMGAGEPSPGRPSLVG